jgi:hypothetical protein
MGYMEYDWYHDWCDEDYEGYRANPESYTPGAMAYSWLVGRVSPSMPISDLMESAELLDLVYDYVDQYQVDEFTLPVFKMCIIFDAELRSLVREFISLVKDYVYVPDQSNVKVAVVNLVFDYLRHRNPDRFV